MISPIELLDTYDEVTPQRNTFEFYTRFYTGILYDLALQAADRFEKKKDFENADFLKKRIALATEREGKYDGYGNSVFALIRELDKEFADKVPSEVEWLTIQTSQSDPRLKSWLADEQTGRLSFPARMESPVLAQSTKATTIASYAYLSVALLDALQRTQAINTAIQKKLRAPVYAMLLSYRARNEASHINITAMQDKSLSAIQEWLADRDDIAFGQDFFQLYIPTQQHQDRNRIQCLPICYPREGSAAIIPLSFLERNKQSDSSNLLGRYIYLRLDSCGWEDALRDFGYSNYIRLSPFIAIYELDLKRKIINPNQIGFLANRARSQSLRYIRLESFAVEPNAIEGMKWSERLESDSGAYFYKASDDALVLNSRNGEWEDVGGDCSINTSRHPEFLEAVGRSDALFVYYPVMDVEGTRKIEELIAENGKIYLILVSGHGGLGKTHMALNLIRDRFKFVKEGTPSAYPQRIVFVSAKQTRMNIITRTQELIKDYDFSDYDSLMKKLYEIFVGSNKIDNLAEDTIVDLLTIQERPILLILDDFDSVDIADQERIAVFLNHIKGKNCRILITSRLITNRILVKLDNATSIQLYPLDMDRTEEFLKEYLYGHAAFPESARKLQNIRGYSKEKLYKLSGGIPLNLALIAELMSEGRDESLWETAEHDIENVQNFIFRNIISNLGEDSRLILSTLCAYLRIVYTRDSRVSSLNYVVLRVMIPQIDENAFQDGLAQLESYSVIYRTDWHKPLDASVKLRSDSFIYLEQVKDIPMMPIQKALMSEINKNSDAFAKASGYPPSIFDMLLTLAKAWNEGTHEELEWSMTMANCILGLNSNMISPSQRNAWEQISPLSELEAANVSLRGAQGGNIILIANQLLDSMEASVNFWPSSKSYIHDAFLTLTDKIEHWDFNLYPDELPNILANARRIYIKCREKNNDSDEFCPEFAACSTKFFLIS